MPPAARAEGRGNRLPWNPCPIILTQRRRGRVSEEKAKGTQARPTGARGAPGSALLGERDADGASFREQSRCKVEELRGFLESFQIDLVLAGQAPSLPQVAESA